MGSEVIVLSSDDEDDAWFLAKPHKRCKIVDATDTDVSVIEKMPCLEARTIDKSSLDSSTVADRKTSQDDDCCILNYDPENRVHVPDFQANDADDLVVVGERGPVACRDFPHARHLCVKFPYTTTPHEKHCEQCHCYVCDVLAPCLHWGQGRQSSDHCHAFDKDDKWRKLRTQARSRAAKLSAQPAPLQQVQFRTYTQPPLRVNLTTTGFRGSNYSAHPANFNASLHSLNQGKPNLRGSTYPANVHASIHSFNQGTPNLNGLPANWQSYLPSHQSNMLSNGSYGNRVAAPETNTCVGNSYSASNTTGRRVFSEHTSPVVNVPIATVTPPAAQHGVYHQLSTPHESLRNTQTRNHRQGAMSQSSPTPALQAGTYLPNFTGSPLQHYQDQRSGSFSAVPYNYSERPCALHLSNFNKDLVILQSYLMEGISGDRQSEATFSKSNVQPSEGASQMAPSRVMDPLYNPFEPSETPASDNAGDEVAASQMTNIRESEQINKDSGNISLDFAGNKKNTDQPLNVGHGTDDASLLDQIFAGFDDDFWTMLEPTLPGF